MSRRPVQLAYICDDIINSIDEIYLTPMPVPRSLPRSLTSQINFPAMTSPFISSPILAGSNQLGPVQ